MKAWHDLSLPKPNSCHYVRAVQAGTEWMIQYKRYNGESWEKHIITQEELTKRFKTGRFVHV